SATSTPSLHDALPILAYALSAPRFDIPPRSLAYAAQIVRQPTLHCLLLAHTSLFRQTTHRPLMRSSPSLSIRLIAGIFLLRSRLDRKSTRLNSSHVSI